MCTTEGNATGQHHLPPTEKKEPEIGMAGFGFFAQSGDHSRQSAANVSSCFAVICVYFELADYLWTKGTLQGDNLPGKRKEENQIF
jgi:hypothetical protein